MFDPEKVSALDSGVGSLIEDYAFLYGCVSLLRPARIAEVGTNRGVSAIVMAQALEDMGADGTVYTVDVSADQLAVAMRQIISSSVSHRISVIHGDVAALPDGRFDLAFIDGGHKYPAVRRDLEALHPRSSFILLHDAMQCPDVRKAADEFEGGRLLISPPSGRQFSGGKIVARTAPGWYVLIPPGERK